jgi:hypothetical protein
MSILGVGMKSYQRHYGHTVFRATEQLLVPGIGFLLVFRPLFRLLFCYLLYLLGLTTRRMFRLCGESLSRSRLN